MPSLFDAGAARKTKHRRQWAFQLLDVLQERRDGAHCGVVAGNLGTPAQPDRRVWNPDAATTIILGTCFRQACNYFSELGSERFFGDFLSSNETSFCPEDGTGTAPSRTIFSAANFFP